MSVVMGALRGGGSRGGVQGSGGADAGVEMV